MPIETPARIAFLKKIHLFYGLDDAELGTVADELKEVTVAKGEVVFAQDSKADSFYLIYSGNVRITRKQDKKEIQLALLVKNDYFGEMALVANRKRSATVVALVDTTLLTLPRANFEKLYKHSHIKNNLSIAIRSRQLARSLTFKWLRPDEVIYFLARKHSIVLWEKLALPFLALLAPAGLFYLWYALIHFLIIMLAGVIALVAISLYMIWLWIDWGNDYYIVTNQRVVWLEKVVGIYDSRQESPLGTIVSVGLEVSQLGKIMDYGNVIVRTFVGKIPFNHVNHPNHAAKMIEEYWNRTKEHAQGMEKEAMKNAIRKRLGLPMPKQGPGFGEPAPLPKSSAPPPKISAGMATLLKFLGANTLKLRYETGDSVIYRKHWVVLVIEAWTSVLGVVGTLLLFIGRLIQLAFLPDEAFISLQGGFTIDAWTLAFLIAFVPFAIWFGYEVLDWSNDKFEVTNDQIIDIDRKPFGTESRNAAPLENILGTVYERKGILGNIFNFGTVYITVGGNKLAFEDVMDPATVQSDIDRRRMARTAKKNEGAVTAERERMAEWLATYHRAAKDFNEEEKRNQK